LAQHPPFYKTLKVVNTKCC